VSLQIDVPSLGVKGLSLKSKLNSTGYSIIWKNSTLYFDSICQSGWILEYYLLFPIKYHIILNEMIL
jgi:hypothetical protein